MLNHSVSLDLFHIRSQEFIDDKKETAVKQSNAFIDRHNSNGKSQTLIEPVSIKYYRDHGVTSLLLTYVPHDRKAIESKLNK